MSLVGIKVIELAGLAPGPFAGLVLADNGASVIRVDKPSAFSTDDVLCRGKRSLAIHLKVTSGRDVLRKLIGTADVVIDPFRPGVMEKLGLGPEVFLGNNGSKPGLNERLIYARLAGFPRMGPYKDMAGHDINYLALSGILSMLPGSKDKPTFPLNLVADFAGGGLTCVTGILLALIEQGKSGKGQVVETDMVSGTRYISSFPLALHALQFPTFAHGRGQNFLDGGAPFYDVYTCKDGRWISVGCLEPKFFAVFLERFMKPLPSSFSSDWRPKSEDQYDRGQWPKLRAFLTAGFRLYSRDDWAAIFHDGDSCATPVLTPSEAAALHQSHSLLPTAHPIISSNRKSYPEGTNRMESIVLEPGRHTSEVLAELGLSKSDQTRLALDGALGDAAQADALVRTKL